MFITLDCVDGFTTLLYQNFSNCTPEIYASYFMLITSIKLLKRSLLSGDAFHYLYMFKRVQNKNFKRSTFVFLIQHNESHRTRSGLEMTAYRFPSPTGRSTSAFNAYACYSLSYVARVFSNMMGLHKFSLTPRWASFIPPYPHCPCIRVITKHLSFRAVKISLQSLTPRKQRSRENRCRICVWLFSLRLSFS